MNVTKDTINTTLSRRKETVAKAAYIHSLYASGLTLKEVAKQIKESYIWVKILHAEYQQQYKKIVPKRNYWKEVLLNNELQTAKNQ